MCPSSLQVDTIASVHITSMTSNYTRVQTATAGRLRCRGVWTSETLANGACVSRSWIGICSRGNVLCAHKKCVESTSNATSTIGDGCENERNKPRIEFPFVGVSGRASAFLSIARAQGWRKYGAVGLCGYINSRQFSDVCLVKIERTQDRSIPRHALTKAT